MKVKLDKLTTEINQKIKAITGQIEEVTRRLRGMERNMEPKDRKDIGVKITLIQLLNH